MASEQVTEVHRAVERDVARARRADAALQSFWALPAAELAARLGSGEQGLSDAQAAARLRDCGPNVLERREDLSRWRVLWNQLRSPLVWLLLIAAAISAATGEWTDALIVLAIVAASAGVGYRREYRSQTAAAALQARAKTRATVVRAGAAVSVALEDVVPGDVVLLAAGSLVPADGVVLEATDCHVSEAALTGESFPVEKRAGSSAAATPLGKRTNCVYLGTNVRSGTARCLIVKTGSHTEFGGIARRLSLRPPETEFDRGLRRFGYLITTAMGMLMLLVFFAHTLRGGPPVETLLFAIALAVGLSPELLPAILSVNLGRAAELMSNKGVLVRRLNAIENLGSMDVLCTDKTGTLTEGVVRVEGAYDPFGAAAQRVLELAALNATFETGLPSPLDDAILNAHRPNLDGLRKRAEIPFDFTRKRVSTVIEGSDGVCLIVKGAFHHIVEICTHQAGGTRLEDDARAALECAFARWSRDGIRVLAVATRAVPDRETYGRDDERDLTFEGFVTFLDRPKEGVSRAIADLTKLGVSLKLITGDAKLVAQHVAALVGMPVRRVLTGSELDALHDEALWREAERTDVFAEVDPNQKERIILALKKMGHVVGFLGDGVNDAPAMHAADTSISVREAVDVAREAADFLLLERHLDVIRRGIEEGRRTFANTLKYVLTTMSANLGNMLSMAAASLFLPFLPLLAGQVLLNNFLSDVPAIGLADDDVDPELIESPRRWDMRFIGRFMLEFGLLSSVFDLLTFGALLYVFAAGPALFRTAWFVESLITELAIALVVRTRRPFFRSHPGRLLWVSTLAVTAAAVVLPYLPGVGVLGFVPMPAPIMLALVGITFAYIAATELLKHHFYARGSA